MKFNYKPSKVAFIDFETQSNCPLTTVHKYVSHESTQALTCVVKVDDDMWSIGPYLGDEAKQLLTNIAKERTLVAHNAPFDGAIWERVLGLPEAEWFDTLGPTRASGLPGGLDAACQALFGHGKDPRGKRLIEMLCILKPNQKPPAVGPAHKLLLEYNETDVVRLEELFNRVKLFVEPELLEVDYRINQRGVPVDSDYLMALREMFKHNKEKLKADFEQATGACPTSPKQVKEWMQKKGFRIPTQMKVGVGVTETNESIGKAAMADFFARPEEHYLGEDEGYASALSAVKEAMDMRKECVGVGLGKAEAAWDVLDDDDRMRELFVYYAAHLGRWTSRRVQLHNMPHAARHVDALDVEPTYEAVVAAAKAATEVALSKKEPPVYNADVLNAMLRHMVRSPSGLNVADYGAVEARCLAWLARCEKQLAIYQDPRKSIYLDMGEHVFRRPLTKKGDPVEYTFAKSLVLGCGYGMSGAKFDFTCKNRNIDTSSFEAMGTKVSDAVKVYREAYPEIVQLWHEYGRAALECVRYRLQREAGRCLFAMVGNDMHIVLPSGRPVVYRNARIEGSVPAYCKLYGMAERKIDTVMFDHPRGYTSFLYGAKITENVDQATCRDIMKHALCNLASAGYSTVFHVHDEIGDEGENHLDEMLVIMTDTPKWAAGFPCLAEGYYGSTWTKAPPKSYYERSAQNGRLL